MKTQTKTIAVVLALFLVAACFIGASSARDVAVGHDAFVYETIKVTNASENATTLAKYSGDATPVVLNTINANSKGEFELLEEAVGTYTGVYRVNGNANETINIWYPEMSLKAYLGETSYDTIDGKTITKSSEVRFVVGSPKVGAATSNETGGLNPVVRVLFTTPVGGKTTDFGLTPINGGWGTANFDNLYFNGSVQIISAVAKPGDNANAGTYVAQAEFKGADSTSGAFPGIPDKYKKSNTVSFTVQSTSLTLTANKDSVVRSNPFTVTIQGESQTVYFVYLDGASSSGVNPTLQLGQNGMKSYTASAVKTGAKLVDDTQANLKNTFGYFTTDASGKRTVQYNTAANTEDKTYTVKVYLMAEDKDGGNVTVQTYDSVKVKVEKGAVTVTASGDRSYYIGEEIKLTGTNTDSTNVFLFITGPNLANDGIQLAMVAQKDDESSAARLNGNPESVKTDNTWEYKWDTSNCGLDTGAYTIYATSMLTNGKSSTAANVTGLASANFGSTIDGKVGKWAVKLSDSEYGTVSVNLKQPFLSATPSGTTVAKGDKIYIRGTAEGDPNNLMLYIFGPNFFEDHSVTVEDDGSYEKKIDIPDSMSSNQYFVVIQHPMYNGIFDAKLAGNAGSRYFYVPNTNSSLGNQASFIVEGTGKLQGSNAADALTKMIDNANIDDIYTKLTFTVQEAWIKINNPGDQAVGTKFTITGTTNLAVDDQILIEVVSSSFNPIDKTSTSTTSGFSQTTKVVKGDGTDNAWSIEVDSTNFKLDEYTIKASGIEADVTTTTNFNLVEKVTPTTVTTAPTGTSAPATTVPTATPTQAKTPGFGAFLALAGLGAVALLVLRRN